MENINESGTKICIYSMIITLLKTMLPCNSEILVH